jgi:hypothetical protein
MRDKEKVKEYNKMYRQKNKDFIKKIQKEYYDKHRDKRIKNASDWQKKNKSQFLLSRRAYMSTPRGRLNSIKSSANTRKIDFKLTEQEAISIMENACWYCGETRKIGIDRKDSDIGYTPENCVSCCSMCNCMKNIYTQEAFLAQCKKIANYLILK